jgi:hypothetical protein
MRSKAGLSGNLRTKGKQETKAPPTSEAPAQVGKKRGRKPKVKARDQGKTPFVKKFLDDHPEANVNEVNEAWKAAGFEGTISPTLVYQMRKQPGLTGSIPGKAGKTEAASRTKPSTGKRRGRKPKETTPATTGGETRGRGSARTQALHEVETEIDRLLFKVMGVGDLTEIEDSLRRARRHLYGALTGG